VIPKEDVVGDSKNDPGAKAKEYRRFGQERLADRDNEHPQILRVADEG
jgi:hypothetical protein